MKVRSRGLMAVSLAMLAASGTLAWVLEHDAVGDPRLVSGDQAETRLRGTLTPLVLHGRAQREVGPHLDNYTYMLQPGPEPGLEVIVTSPVPLRQARTAEPVVVAGPLLWSGAHPDHPATRMAVIRADHVEAPILFR